MEKEAKGKKDFDPTINDRFLEPFLKLKMPLSTVAREMGVSDVALQHIKNYRNLPSSDTLIKGERKFRHIGFNMRYILLNEKETPNEIKLREELEKVKLEKEESQKREATLFNILGKSESMTKSLLIDSEKGVNVMNALLGQKAGHALSKRDN